ncbi:cytochrome P450 [Streptomyces sp. ID05-18]|uniref:cytochrome P450 n=1 Tax=Streptomyces sp. ID05-18 TaxID=3028662 RepID=UPI0029C03586|nr:cytochrome P450 [Streptomyces sp. ID05-18]
MRITCSGARSDWRAVDLTDPVFYAQGDPHAVWRAMRDEAPVHRHRLADGREYVSVTRYADVRTVVGDHQVFSSRRGNMLSVLGGHDPAADRMMVSSDPPIHTELRAPLMKHLSQQRMRELGPAIRAMARRLLAPLADGDTWDVAESVAMFPMMFTGLLMGLPERDWPELVRLTSTSVAPDDPAYGADGDSPLSAHHELFDYFVELAHTGEDDREDLVGAIRRMTPQGRRIRTDEVIYNCYNVLLGATVTAPHVIASTVLAFTEHPDAYARITPEADAVDLAVTEALRWSSPATHAMRYTNAATEIGGVPIGADEAVVAWLGSANRDRAVFDDPYRFDVTRRPNPHLAFGSGRHYCIGAPLARVALGEFFGEVVRIAEGFELAGEVRHLVSNFIAGFTSLPVRARLRPGAERELAAARAEGS